jgi:hypothetical protein
LALVWPCSSASSFSIVAGPLLLSVLLCSPAPLLPALLNQRPGDSTPNKGFLPALLGLPSRW